MAANFSGNDGTNDRIECGTPDVPASTPKLTLMAWRKPAASGDRVMSKADGAAGVDHTWMLDVVTDSQQRSRVKAGGSTTTVTSGGVSPFGVWKHFACIYDGVNQKNYGGAALLDSAANSGDIEVDATKEYWIGNQPPTGANTFDGPIEDVRVYSRELSVAELETIFNSNGHDGIVDGLILRHPLNDNSSGAIGAGDAKDLGSLRVNGSGVNAPTWALGENIMAPRRRYR